MKYLRRLEAPTFGHLWITDFSRLNEPGGLAVLGSTALIADTNNNRIVSYDLRTGRISDWPVTQ